MSQSVGSNEMSSLNDDSTSKLDKVVGSLSNATIKSSLMVKSSKEEKSQEDERCPDETTNPNSMIQRRIDHRRNKSEPSSMSMVDENVFASLDSNALIETSSTSTTSNDSSILNSSLNEKKPFLCRNEERSSFSSTSNKKKKSWFNPFQSTYRQRNEEFRKIFKDLPVDERLIVDYSCAWQKEILVQGRMYLSANHFCFYANFLKWETSLIVKLQDIISISREKTAKLIPNAIEIRTNRNEKYFFASFATRDKTYSTVNRVWESVLLKKFLSTQEIWNLIHESYGNDLDMTTDEEDLYNNNRVSLNSTDNQSTHSQCSERKTEFDDQSSFSSRDGEQKTRPTIDRAQQVYLSRCPCRTHLATQLIDRSYSTNVEHLFECIFGSNRFLEAYRASRRVQDYQSHPWKINNLTGKRERLCTYKVTVAAVLGATIICSNEKQIIESQAFQSHYIIDTEVRNQGIKYADAFFVASRYCLYQTGSNKCHLTVTCEVRYVKSLMIIIKSFIEKNATAALQDSYTDLMKRLEQECSNRPKQQSLVDKEPSSEKRVERSSSSSNLVDRIQSNGKKKFFRKSPSVESKSSIEDISSINVDDDDLLLDQSAPTVRSSSWLNQRSFVYLSLTIMFVLLVINLFLCIKLNQIDEMTDRLMQTHPIYSFEYLRRTNEPVPIKQHHEHDQQKLVDLRSLLLSTFTALKNVTETLNHLSKTSLALHFNISAEHL